MSGLPQPHLSKPHLSSGGAFGGPGGGLGGPGDGFLLDSLSSGFADALAVA